MNISRYWAQSTEIPGKTVGCWRWSDVSPDDAQQRADERAAELQRMFDAGNPLDHYGYSDRPLREEIIHSIGDDSPENRAVITRNAYGVLVLNAPTTMFIDIDFEIPGRSVRTADFFRRLMGRPKPPPAEDQLLQTIQDWSAHHSDIGLRIYRTFAGVRGLITNQTFDPAELQTQELLKSLGSDPMYVRLCRAQSNFRARLTPKPWRCKTAPPPSRYPWKDRTTEDKFRSWQTGYEKNSAGYTVCRFLRHFGRYETHPQIRPVLEFHDQATCGPADQLLA